MLGIRYRKVNPTDYVCHYSNGAAVHEGTGLSFVYFAPVSTTVIVPLASTNLPFAFSEPTADFQSITVQGQVTYRIAQPRLAATMLDFTVDADGKYVSDQYRKVAERVIHALETLVRADLQQRPLHEALTAIELLTQAVMGAINTSPDVRALGVEVLNLAIVALTPVPDVAKALEAATREAMNRAADEAIYARRNAAIEQERYIRENELRTDQLVQQKQQALREAELGGAIALETQRASLTAKKADNDRQEADARAYALGAVLAPVRDVDWRLLTMLHGGTPDPRATIAMAFQELAANAGKIGEVNVTPDLLRSLIGSTPGRS
jgi:hypothetical protein